MATVTVATAPSRRAGPLQKLIGELQRRRVGRSAISYTLLIWLNVQIGDVFFPIIGLPDWSVKLLLAIGILGFPVVLVLSWLLQITRQGIAVDAPIADSGHSGSAIDRALNAVLLLLGIVLLGVLALSWQAPPQASRSAAPALPVVLVDLRAAELGAGRSAYVETVQDAVMHHLIRSGAVRVAPIGSDCQGYVVQGSVARAGDGLRVMSRLLDCAAQQYVYSDTFRLAASQTAEPAAVRVAERVLQALGLAAHEPPVDPPLPQPDPARKS